MLTQLHSGHVGTDACISRAIDNLYWLWIQSEIKQMTQVCAVCNEFRPDQTRQLMILHPMPDHSWSTVSADLYMIEGTIYLIVVNHNSDFWQTNHVNNTTSSAMMQCHFSRYGIPDFLISDNGPQLFSTTFSEFFKKWGFGHITSFPWYPPRRSQQLIYAKICLRSAK